MVDFQTNIPKILGVLRSPRFFWAIMALFVLESVWIAVSAAYPMVFDENTHFGVIQLYAHHLSPIWSQQPPNADFAGALTRDPSFMYQYLMSFPYRLLAALTDNQMLQIIGLRLINVALFGAGLVLFRRLLLKTKVSPAIVHVALLFFILTPVVPLLAGQINYDNLLMPLVALTLLMTLDIHDRLRRDKWRLPIGRLLLLLTLGCFASLVQFEFLPILTAVCLWLAWDLWQRYKRGALALRRDLTASWQASTWSRRLFIGLPFLLIFGLFVQKYGVNLVLYHTPIPQCGEVLSAQHCQANGAWARNEAALLHRQPVNINPMLFGASWTYRMFIAMFYTSSGGASPSAFYLSINPLPVIFATALLIFAVGVLLAIKYHRQIFRRYKYLGFLAFVCLFYVAALWLRNYHDFIHYGQKLAINGRYLFPIALPAMLLIALAYRQLFADKHHLKLGLMIVVFVLFLQGGGALTYIAVSNQNWYWPNQTVIGMNRLAQQVVKPLIFIKTPLKSFGKF
jgi:hypothetical protein